MLLPGCTLLMHDSVKPDPRDKGLNFRVATCKGGKNNDATFDKFKPLYEGEKYVESLRCGGTCILIERPDDHCVAIVLMVSYACQASLCRNMRCAHQNQQCLS